MRQAGTIATKPDAERFANYLLTLGITTKVEPDNGQWAIWVHDENALPRSRAELEQFHRAPQDVRYAEAEQAARAARREAAEKKRQAQRNYVDLRNDFASPWSRRPVTMAMIMISVLVVLLHGFGGDPSLAISSTAKALPEVEQGEIWRLVTPIFMHFGLLHLVFNVYWLYDLGTLIERRVGSLSYAALVIAITIPSNYAQFEATGPAFGGLSGVVFGLFGYAWVRGRMDPTCGLYLRPDITYWMFGWFLLCLTPVVRDVANWAHGMGLVVGASLGYAAYLGHSLRKKA